MSTQLWWFVARAAGLVSWGLATVSVLWGLALSTRALGRKPPAPWLLDLHRFLGGLTVVFVVVHMAGLFLDTYAHFGLADLLVPFATQWKPLPVAWGIVGFYLLLAVEITSLLKKRLPKKWWYRVHLLSYVLFIVGTVHMLTAGTDASNPWVRFATVASVGAVLFFSLYRWIGPGRTASVKSSGKPASTRSPSAKPASAKPASATVVSDAEPVPASENAAPVEVKSASRSEMLAAARSRSATSPDVA